MTGTQHIEVINTDNLSPGYYIAQGFDELAKHCLEAVRPEFSRNAKPGDIVLGGTNFGTGSSRETAPATLKHLGISLVIAKSFARIFYKNAINIALPLMVCEGIYDAAADGDMVSADLTRGVILHERTGDTFQTEPLPAS